MSSKYTQLNLSLSSRPHLEAIRKAHGHRSLAKANDWLIYREYEELVKTGRVDPVDKSRGLQVH